VTARFQAHGLVAIDSIAEVNVAPHDYYGPNFHFRSAAAQATRRREGRTALGAVPANGWMG
jgi:hypothetical protein